MAIPAGPNTEAAHKASHSLFVKEVYLLILEFWSEGEAFGMVHIEGQRNGIFPAISVAKDITAINDCCPSV